MVQGFKLVWMANGLHSLKRCTVYALHAFMLISRLSYLLVRFFPSTAGYKGATVFYITTTPTEGLRNYNKCEMQWSIRDYS